MNIHQTLQKAFDIFRCLFKDTIFKKKKLGTYVKLFVQFFKKDLYLHMIRNLYFFMKDINFHFTRYTVLIENKFLTMIIANY